MEQPFSSTGFQLENCPPFWWGVHSRGNRTVPASRRRPSMCPVLIRLGMQTSYLQVQPPLLGGGNIDTDGWFFDKLLKDTQ